MSSHLRHCPKHRKPLPCPHCALTVKSAQTAIAVMDPEPPTVETLPVPAKRGRKSKYATEEERKAAEAAHKRGKRKDKAEDKRVTELANRTGADFKTGPEDALLISSSGGYNTTKIDRVVGKQDTSRLSSPNADASEELTTSDRRVTAVPKNPDTNTNSTRETDNTFMRRAGAALRRWAKGPVKKSCISEHAGIAERHKDSKRKLYCGKCRKLLVNPGKPVKGISIRDAAGNFVPISSGNFPDALPGEKKTSTNTPQSIDTKADTPIAA